MGNRTLERAITQAIENGWRKDDKFGIKTCDSVDLGVNNSVMIRGLAGAGGGTQTITCMTLERLIFDHDFAKALWGDSLLHDVIARDYSRSDKVYWTLDPMYMPPNNWEFHLQQMVVSPNPVEYLARNGGRDE